MRLGGNYNLKNVYFGQTIAGDPLLFEPFWMKVYEREW